MFMASHVCCFPMSLENFKPRFSYFFFSVNIFPLKTVKFSLCDTHTHTHTHKHTHAISLLFCSSYFLTLHHEDIFVLGHLAAEGKQHPASIEESSCHITQEILPLSPFSFSSIISRA